MAYFTGDFLAYLRALAKHNEREWFHANKARYESAVKQPFEDFVAEMIDRIGALDPAVAIEPKNAIFRLARDIRFSNDKTPYKTYVAAVVSRGGRRDMRSPGLYFAFSTKSVSIAGGLYRPERDDLLRVRRAIQRDGKTLDRLLKAKAFTERFGELRGEKNKIVPKEFKADLVRFPLLAHKQFYYWAEHPARTALRPDLADFLVKHYKAGKKVADFLQAAID